MKTYQRLLICLPVLVLGLFFMARPEPAQAYVEAPMSFGAIVGQSTHIMVLRVTKVDNEKNLIIFQKVEDLKGKHPTDVVKHSIGKAGFHPREWQYSMQGAEVGKIGVFFHNGGAGEMFLGNYWYQIYPGEWWAMSHGEPFLLRSYSGSPEKLIAAIREMVAGRETVVPCMVDGNKDDLHLRRAKIQRLKVSLKLADYNPKRDFIGWGGEDFRRIAGMPGFTHYSALTRCDPEAQAVSAADVDGDGKPDLCLVGGGRAVPMQNGGDAMNELTLPNLAGARAAVWADYNADGKPDLLVAGTNGPRLYTNLGAGNFRDDSHLLPKEAGYNLTAAAWIDQDGDGKPDLLLGNGFHGLRLYRNKGTAPATATPLVLGKWSCIGPFDNTGMKGFAAEYPPEKEIALTKKYRGKGNQEVAWKEGNFSDGQINNLAIFPDNNDVAVYLHREITCTDAMELPCTFGSDDTLSVWLNGQKVIAENVYRAAAADQNAATLKLTPGKNQLLIKICQGQGEFAYYFQSKNVVPPQITWLFEDVSTQVGLGPDGVGGAAKGDALAVADVNSDGRQDFLYGAGSGILVLNTPKGFVLAKDSGISFKSGKVGPVFADCDGDGHLDLFVPQDGACKLFKGDGQGKFTDVSAKAGDLARPIPHAACAAWGDVDNDGQVDLVVGRLKGPNLFFKNQGNGTFVDASAEIGLDQRIFNTQGICLVDLNQDGALDMIFANEGQESCILLGNVERVAGKKSPVTLLVKSDIGVLGSRVRVLDGAGKPVASHDNSGGDGRGGQSAPLARFALAPGAYKVEVRLSSGAAKTKDITVAAAPLRMVIE